MSRPARPIPLHMAIRAVAAVLLILGLAFAVFGVGFFIEGQFDLADGRMDGRAGLDLSEDIATDWFWRRIRTMFGFSAFLVACGIAGFGIAAAMKRKPHP